MPARSKVAGLPKAVREWLDAVLADGNFSGYEQLAGELKSRGHDISKSALHRHGEKLERRLQAIKASTEAAKAIVASTADDEDARSEAVISMTQHHLFESLHSLSEANTTEDAEARLALLAHAGKGISSIVQASIARKKFARDVRRQALQEAAAAVEKVGKKAGASDDAIDLFRREILGIVDEPARA